MLKSRGHFGSCFGGHVTFICLCRLGTQLEVTLRSLFISLPTLSLLYSIYYRLIVGKRSCLSKKKSCLCWLDFCHIVWVTCRVHAHVELGSTIAAETSTIGVETVTLRVYNTPPFL